MRLIEISEYQQMLDNCTQIAHTAVVCDLVLSVQQDRTGLGFRF